MKEKMWTSTQITDTFLPQFVFVDRYIDRVAYSLRRERLLKINVKFSSR